MPGQGNTDSGSRRTGALIATLVVLAGLAVFAWVQIQPTHASEDLCDQGAVLKAARLLDEAQEAYAQAKEEGRDCKEKPAQARSPLGLVEAGQTRAEESFTRARVFTGAKRTWRAISSYATGLELNPFDEAGSLGLAGALKELQAAGTKAAATVRCRLGRRLAKAALLDDAGTAVSAGLPKAPKPCRAAARRLGKRSAHAAGLFRAARRLEGEGETGSAQTRYAGALRVNSDLGEARTALEDSFDDESKLDWLGSKLAGIPGTLKTALSWLIPLVLIALVAALLAWIAVRQASVRWPWARSAAESLGRQRGLSFFHNAAVPTVSIEPFGGNDAAEAAGKDFSTLLAAALPRQAGREPAFPYDRVVKGSPDDGAAADAAGLLAAVPETKLLGSLVQLLSRLFRRRSIHVVGHLAPISDAGAGVTVTLEGIGSSGSVSITLWEEMFDPLPGGKGAARWLRLLPAATIWVRWQLATHGPSEEAQGLDPDRWEADAFFRTGVVWQSLEEPIRAEALYAKAVETDPMLLAASHNLAVVETQNEHYEQAREWLLALRTKLEGWEKSSPKEVSPREQWPTLDTSSLYTLSLAYAYPVVAQPNQCHDGDLTEALKYAGQLVETLARELEENAKRGREGKEYLDERLREELEDAEPPSVVLLASLSVRSSPELRDDAARHAAGVKKLKPRELERSDLCEKAGENEPWDLIDGYVLSKGRAVSRRTRYNLACYYTTLAEGATGSVQQECLKRAYTFLDESLTDVHLLHWASEDPSLQWLQAVDEERFEEVLEKHAVPAHATEDGEDDEDGDAAKPEAPEAVEPYEQVLVWLRGQLGL